MLTAVSNAGAQLRQTKYRTLAAGGRSYKTLPALVSLKAEIGHTLGASGAAELALLTACLEAGVWPAPRCAPDPTFGVTLTPTTPTVRYLMSTILGFGGGHATIILEDCTRSPDAGLGPESWDALPDSPGFRCAASGLHTKAYAPAPSWRITGRCFAAPPPANWREALAERLGFKPRRIGRWAELALYGALSCLEDAGEATLPPDALVNLASLHGPDQALRVAVLEAQDGQPMPLGFLQSQPNQVLAHLAKALNWQGDARCLTTREPLHALRAACSQAGPGGLLLGWVSENGAGSSHWLRLHATKEAAFAPLPETLESLFQAERGGFSLKT